MAITVRHDVPLAYTSAVAQQIGTNTGIGQAAADEQRRAQFLLGLGERAKDRNQDAQQFAVNTALRVDAVDEEKLRYRTQLARQDATQQRLEQNAEADRQAQFAQQRMEEEYNLYGQQQQQAAAWAMEQSKTLDQQASERFAAIRKLKLTPEGQRIVGELAGKYRSIQSDPTLRADARQQALGLLMADVERSDVDSYVDEPPTQEQWLADTTYTLPDGTVLGKDRSGMPRVLKEPTFQPLKPEEYVANTHYFPDGSGIFINPRTGKEVVIPAPKPEKSEKEKLEPVMSQRDKNASYESVANEIKMIYEADLEEVMEEETKVVDGKSVTTKTPTGKYKHPSGKTFLEFLDENLKSRIANRNRVFGDPEEETLIPSELRGSTLQSQIDPMSGGGINIDAMQGVMGEAAGMAPDEPPVEISSREEAESLEVGSTFIFNGQLFRVTGPGEAEPVEMQ